MSQKRPHRRTANHTDGTDKERLPEQGEQWIFIDTAAEGGVDQVRALELQKTSSSTDVSGHTSSIIHFRPSVDEMRDAFWAKVTHPGSRAMPNSRCARSAQAYQHLLHVAHSHPRVERTQTQRDEERE